MITLRACFFTQADHLLPVVFIHPLQLLGAADHDPRQSLQNLHQDLICLTFASDVMIQAFTVFHVKLDPAYLPERDHQKQLIAHHIGTRP